jgi:hypothetical protein
MTLNYSSGYIISLGGIHASLINGTIYTLLKYILLSYLKVEHIYLCSSLALCPRRAFGQRIASILVTTLLAHRIT